MHAKRRPLEGSPSQLKIDTVVHVKAFVVNADCKVSRFEETIGWTVVLSLIPRTIKLGEKFDVHETVGAVSGDGKGNDRAGNRRFVFARHAGTHGGHSKHFEAGKMISQHKSRAAANQKPRIMLDQHFTMPDVYRPCRPSFLHDSDGKVVPVRITISGQ
jgi:hypothetical protein